ncbi:MAG: FtsX-like permease family protein [Acidobacteria bacterium]|jgi:ABC-type antimicrobial peptide transport system permease subunit|nr:FtsX-like permease family protein [Acidobacteriota bacterium]
MVALTFGGVVLIGVLLAFAASALYALMSFSVMERTREIGIRVALGADRARIALTVARRALMQLGVGVLLGMPVAGRIFFELFDDAGSTYSAVSGSVLALIVGMSVMGLIGVVACTAPLLRALRIAPTEALKGGG